MDIRKTAKLLRLNLQIALILGAVMTLEPSFDAPFLQFFLVAQMPVLHPK